jgi:2-polyprenyl-3-methyl-5-hydroxy-6-metoxy-1,4-benzoquinol methylase
MVYVQRFGSQRRAPYTRDYFFEEYRRQYGKTYLDDWPDLLRLAEGRIALIEELAGEVLGRREGLSLLDVGCAYGPFLAAAKARGHEPYGLDAVPEAARYVREELGIPAIAGDFIDPAVAESFGGPFDALSMWYVIEHFEDLDAALLNAAALVRPGGIFALSTPSGEGVSARSSWRDFCEKSPEDHFTVWEPSRVRPILRAYGFTLEKTRVTGHHPERFPLYRRLFGDRGGLVGGLLKSVLRCWSRLFHLGDTFEIYARRMGGESPVSAPLKLRETLGAEKTAKT